MTVGLFREIPVTGGALPEWLHVLPLGHYAGHPTVRPFTVDAKMCDEVIRNFGARGTDMPIDWEHQSEVGGIAPAAGWVDRLEARADGLWAHVKEWTARAREHLLAREYRYLSPAVRFGTKDPTTGKPAGTWMSSVALTNIPFFGGDLHPVLNRGVSRITTGVSMLLMGLIAAGLLPEGTTEEAALPILTDKLKGAAPEGEMKAKAELGEAVIGLFGWSSIPADAKDQVAAAKDHEGFVSADKYFTDLAAAKASAAGPDKAELLTARAVESGKVTPANRALFKGWAKKDHASASAYIDNAPVAVEIGTPPRRDGGGDPDAVVLTSEDKALCKSMGIDEGKFLVEKKRKRATREG